jgi:hypothetical protein
MLRTQQKRTGEYYVTRDKLIYTPFAVWDSEMQKAVIGWTCKDQGEEQKFGKKSPVNLSIGREKRVVG